MEVPGGHGLGRSRSGTSLRIQHVDYEDAHEARVRGVWAREAMSPRKTDCPLRIEPCITVRRKKISLAVAKTDRVRPGGWPHPIHPAAQRWVVGAM